MFVCVCNAVTETQVRQCVANGAKTLGDLQFELGVASCCGCCAATAESYLAGANVHEVETHDAAVAVLSAVREANHVSANHVSTNHVSVRPSIKQTAKPVEHISTRRYPVHQIIARAA
ncbi:bacterioferritin [Pigmentiphaga aceris]|uniref:Bacterioferritin-associated ferredoxin n=1 Tax=Pigmentiphaga aceris TaxID=1940612 RepID=A0A5C0ATB9_9BURK|nr:bacterioferritin [Pigmentiphaga aceris]